MGLLQLDLSCTFHTTETQLPTSVWDVEASLCVATRGPDDKEQKYDFTILNIVLSPTVCSDDLAILTILFQSLQ